jgi:exodeoxyribonuclease VII large subunit
MEKGSIAVNQKSYSLLEVLQSIQSVIKNTYGSKLFWVRCELSRISLHTQSGHCYLELIEKNESSILAQLHGIIWADKYNAICEKFLSITQTKLAAGIKVMFQCSVSFHPVHGLSLFITDIEPSFTLGEMARMKNESIAKLKAEGLFDINRRLPISLIPGRIAVISVDTSRGYQDFISTLENYPRKFLIKCTLFEAVLQGENAVPSFIRALKIIEDRKENFDAIVIVRGGAGDAGLACYDDYSLAATIARTSLPVISGIGHATNETVVEMVSFKNCITPTAAATFLLEKFELQANRLSENITVLRKASKTYFSDEKQTLSSYIEVFCLMVNHRLSEQEFELKSLHAAMPTFVNSYLLLSRQFLTQSIHTVVNAKKLGNHFVFLSDLNRVVLEIRDKAVFLLSSSNEAIKKQNLKVATQTIERQKELLEFITGKVNLLDPVNTLKRGYSITRHNGKVLTDAQRVKPGMSLETTLANGILHSTIDKNK